MHKARISWVLSQSSHFKFVDGNYSSSAGALAVEGPASPPAVADLIDLLPLCMKLYDCYCRSGVLGFFAGTRCYGTCC